MDDTKESSLLRTVFCGLATLITLVADLTFIKAVISGNLNAPIWLGWIIVGIISGGVIIVLLMTLGVIKAGR